MELSDHDSSFPVSVSTVHAVTVYYLYKPTDLDICRNGPTLSRRDGIPVKEGVIFFTISSRPTKRSTQLPIQWILRVLLPGSSSSSPSTAINESFRITPMFHTHFHGEVPRQNETSLHVLKLFHIIKAPTGKL